MSDRWTVRLMMVIALVLLVSRVAVVAVPNAEDIVVLPTPAAQESSEPTASILPTATALPSPEPSLTPSPSRSPEATPTPTSSLDKLPLPTPTVIVLPTLAPLPTLVPIPTPLPTLIPLPSVCIPTISVASHVPGLVCGHNLNPKICC